MNYFERRRYGKLVHRFFHEANHARNMRADEADSSHLLSLRAAEDNLKAAWAARDPNRIERAVEEISSCILKVKPLRPFPRLRENVEIIVVALAVAMGFRTYFIQPFKIPTGSMQPTLYGITVQPQASKTMMDVFPLRLLQLALFGERYIEVRAPLSGQVDARYAMDEESMVFNVAGVPQKIRRDLTLYFSPGDYLAKGQLMASGRLKIGDHIFVDTYPL